MKMAGVTRRQGIIVLIKRTLSGIRKVNGNAYKLTGINVLQCRLPFLVKAA